MKVPSLKDLRRVNQHLKRNRFVIYRRILSSALRKWSSISGDLTPLGYFRGGQYHLLLEYADSLVVQKYPTAELHFSANQLAALIRKYPWDPSVVQTDPEAKAKDTFRRSEHRCGEMNQWFLAFRRALLRPRTRPQSARKRREQSLVLEAMRSWISYVIGQKPNYETIYDLADFTAGASLGVHGDATNLARKLLAERWSVTPTALPFFASVLSHNFHFATRVAKTNGMVQSLHVTEDDVLGACDLVSYNKVAFVPKTAKTFRSIAVEPLGNGLVQKGIDLYLRNRLKRVGIDLSDQRPNQVYAMFGSIPGISEDPFCTIDLSSASDSISIELVREVLPPAWFDLLNRTRSPSYMLDGEIHRSNKFCTMGNGFCFPLQTLIFASVCHAVQAGWPGKDFRVYGDDIIVRRSHFDRVLMCLKWFGFSPNKKKTYSDGPFRESCGANWYEGKDVSPFTLDFELDCLSSMFKFANLARRNPLSTDFLRECIDIVISSIPDNFRFFRPYKGQSDTGIDCLDIQPTKRLWKWNRNFQTWSWLELAYESVTDRMATPDWVVMAAALRGHPSEQLFTFRRKTKVRVRVIARSGDLCPQTNLEFHYSRLSAHLPRLR